MRSLLPRARRDPKTLSRLCRNFSVCASQNGCRWLLPSLQWPSAPAPPLTVTCSPRCRYRRARARVCVRACVRVISGRGSDECQHYFSCYVGRLAQAKDMESKFCRCGRCRCKQGHPLCTGMRVCVDAKFHSALRVSEDCAYKLVNVAHLYSQAFQSNPRRSGRTRLLPLVAPPRS